MIEAKPGARFTVRDEPINRDNAFWAPLIGKSGVVYAVMPDGLLDVALGEGSIVVATGVKPERFCVFASAPQDVRRPWWKRLWRRSRR